MSKMTQNNQFIIINKALKELELTDEQNNHVIKIIHGMFKYNQNK